MDEENNGHDQLPSVEEIRTASARSMSSRSSGPNKSPCRTSRFGEISIITLIAVLIVTVIGLSVGIAKRGDQVEAATSAASGGTSTSGGAAPTSSPANREPREGDVQQWLYANGVSTWEDMETAGSPHKFALLWIADSDELNLALPDSLDSADGIRFVSRYVAALMFFAMGGETWDYQLSFLSGKDVCEWNDIFVAAEGVQGRFFRIGFACNNGIVNTWQMRE